jgi:hypothetical protein
MRIDSDVESMEAVGHRNASAALVQENAVVLLSRQQQDKEWYEAFEPYWHSLPGPNTTLFCKETFTARDKVMLQDSSLVSGLPGNVWNK